MFILKQLIKLIRLLHADEGSMALALGFSLALFPGFAGMTSVLGLLSLFIVIFFRVQMGAYFLGYFFFSLFSLVFADLFNSIGFKLLTSAYLESFWTFLNQWPLMHWLKFNHTQVLGGQIFALSLFPFTLILLKIAIVKYQKTVVQKVKNSKLYKTISKTSLILNYNNILESLKS